MRITAILLLLMLAVVGCARPTVESRVRQYGAAARGRMKPYFSRANVHYPPEQLAMIAVKDTQELQLYAPDARGQMRFIHTYPILAASGRPGPKLREGDYQVPEGAYRIDFLHPTSSYHLAMHVNYPNAFDKAQAHRDMRTGLGGDIMIHGNQVSAGCLAMGDEAIEELFVLAADTGLRNITLLISPVDFRTTTFSLAKPAWTKELYAGLREKLQDYPLPPVTPTKPAGTPPAARTERTIARQSAISWIIGGGVIVFAGFGIYLAGRTTKAGGGGGWRCDGIISFQIADLDFQSGQGCCLVERTV